MLRIHLLSDLHLELSQYTPHPAAYAANVIIAAGDICPKDHGIHMLRSLFPSQDVVVVLGNHEHYGQDIVINTECIRKAAEETGVYLLENNSVVISGVRICGATSWTDFQLFPGQRRNCMIHAQQYLNDFRLIKNGEWNFSPADSVAIHNNSVAWLESELNKQFDGPTIVVTHHAPSWQSVAQRFQNDPLSACFASRLDYLMDGKKVELWCHGHTHDSFDYYINGTRVIANPRGYNRSGVDGAEENDHFNSSLILEVTKGKVEIADVSLHKLPERIEPRLSGRMRDELIWSIDHLKATTYTHSDFFLEYVDLQEIRPGLSWFVESIVLKHDVLLKCIPEHLAIMPLATVHIERLVEEIMKRSRQTVRAPKRKKNAGINAGKIDALNSLKLHVEDDLKYYDLVELRQDLRAEYWKERFGSTQPVIEGASEPIYSSDYKEWRDQQIKKLK